MPFSKEIKEKALSKSARRCCICLSFTGVKIEVHHIIPEAQSNDNTLENTIPLCFNCHSDVGHYNTKHPKGNKFTFKELKLHRDRLWELVMEGKILAEKPLDYQFLEMLKKAFDRPAFNTPFSIEGKLENFNKAIQDTILALNTGLLRTRDNQIIQDIGFGKSSIVNKNWNVILGDIEILLQSLMKKVSDGLNMGTLKMCHEYCYCGDQNYIDEIDNIRIDVIDQLNSIFDEANISKLRVVLNFRKNK